MAVEEVTLEIATPKGLFTGSFPKTTEAIRYHLIADGDLNISFRCRLIDPLRGILEDSAWSGRLSIPSRVGATGSMGIGNHSISTPIR